MPHRRFKLKDDRHDFHLGVVHHTPSRLQVKQHARLQNNELKIASIA